jgi:putative ABC transport system permease protein
MKLKKSFDLALNILVHSKLRSWLTIIGIIVGIGAVVAIISISNGAQKQLEERLNGLGADVLTVTKGASHAMNLRFGGGQTMQQMYEGNSQLRTPSSTVKNLTSKDVLVIKSVNNVKHVMGSISGTADVSFSSKTVSNARITGVDPSVWKDITSEKLSSGRFLITGDSYSVVIGQRFATNTFDKPITLNTKILINGKSFNVVGILQEGSSIYMPISIARSILDNVGLDSFDSISVKIEDVSLSNQTVNDITNKLMMSRGILKEKNIDFSVSNPASIQETIQQTLNTMTLFLGAIAAISLVVGGIGIANSMFTSVLEKTKDIGIMKAIGAKNKYILMIFLLNSGLIGLVGGIGGVILGFFVSTTISNMANFSSSSVSAIPGRGVIGNFFSSSYVRLDLVLGALLFSVVIGVIAGLIPAYRASKLNPVDALRSE